MDETKESPPDVNSPQVLNLSRAVSKRKLQDEPFDSPVPKHKCWERATASDGPGSTFYESPEIGNTKHFLRKGKHEAHVVYNQSEPESIKDSNSYGEDSDSSTSMYAESKMEPEYGKIGDSTPSSPGDSTMVKPICVGEEGVGPQELLNIEEQLLEFGNHAEYFASEYEEESAGQCTDKELQDIFCANGLNSNMYVLSSGRWTVNQEAQSGSRKPTIDQEFEQYFSMLML